MNAPQKAQSPGGAGQSAKQSTDAQSFADLDTTRKAEATTKAQLALKGHSVFDLCDGAYLVTRWGFTRRCANLTELQNFARQIGEC